LDGESVVDNNAQILLRTSQDRVFSPTAPPSGDFTVELIQESTHKTLGINIFGGAETVKGPSAVFINSLSPDGLAACDGRLRAGKTKTKV